MCAVSNSAGCAYVQQARAVRRSRATRAGWRGRWGGRKWSCLLAAWAGRGPAGWCGYAGRPPGSGDQAAGTTTGRPAVCGVVEVVVDCTTRRPAASQQRRGDGGAVPGGAVHPHLALGHLVQALEQVVQRDVDGAGQMCVLRHSRLRRTSSTTTGSVVADLGQVGERRPGKEPRRPPPAQSAGVPVACAAGRSMPMRTSSRCACGDLLGGLAEQGDRGTPAGSANPGRWRSCRPGRS